MPLDLSTCEREPIHIPGSIQPHGILFVLDPVDLTVLQASRNVEAIVGGPVEGILGLRLGDAVGDLPKSLADDLTRRVPEHGNVHLRLIELGSVSYDAVAHRSDGAIILELEENGEGGGSLDSLYPQIRAFVDELQEQPNEAALNDRAAQQIRGITGFDRVMVYRFDESWNGTVVAESRNERLPSYLDLRFPASDIPAQARKLYGLNRLRLIADADYRSVPIVPEINPRTSRPTDLSFSFLRSVSPVHLEYMKNMGTPSSMSISIMEGGKLWGLISCHSAAPRQVPIHVRTACDFLGQIVAMQISAKERNADAARRREKHVIQTKLLAFMAAEEHFIDGLIRNESELLKLTGAEGAAIVLDGRCVILGEAPDEKGVRKIVDWLATTRPHEEIFATASLGLEMAGGDQYAAVASGLLAVSISQLHASYVLWFRPEVIQTVKWGGDPSKPMTNTPEGPRLHPRRSFEIWKETVRLAAMPWTAAEIDAAEGLHGAIVGIVMRKAEELAQLTDELKRSNKELEAFSYSVSHDLRAPFRHIVGYAELLKDSAELDDRSRRYVDTIIESAFSAGKLVDDLLGFSQMGRSTLTPIRVDMNRLVDEVRRMLRPEEEGRRIEWKVEKLPPAWGDSGMLRQAVQNLLSNALKYTRSKPTAIIEIEGVATPDETVYTVRDNGVGFEMAYVGKLFGVFQRLHRMEEFEGTGIGLANVRRILERHGGRTWAEGAVGKGATFSFALPTQPKD